MIRLSDLRGKMIRSLDGKPLGRVHEVHCNAGQITALVCGPGSLVERWTSRNKGRRIAWAQVHRIEATAIIVSTRRTRR